MHLNKVELIFTVTTRLKCSLLWNIFLFCNCLSFAVPNSELIKHFLKEFNSIIIPKNFKTHHYYAINRLITNLFRALEGWGGHRRQDPVRPVWHASRSLNIFLLLTCGVTGWSSFFNLSTSEKILPLVSHGNCKSLIPTLNFINTHISTYPQIQSTKE